MHLISLKNIFLTDILVLSSITNNVVALYNYYFQHYVIQRQNPKQLRSQIYGHYSYKNYFLNCADDDSAIINLTAFPGCAHAARVSLSRTVVSDT